MIDKFEQYELTTDLKHATPREARLGRWVLLYGILQVLSTLSCDVQGLKHTDGVRYFLCTDLKRLPEWVTNGQIEHLEASQQRSWCWQRAWDPMPSQTAPVELEAPSTLDRNATVYHHDTGNAELFSPAFPSPPPERQLPQPPPSFDGATLMQNDIRRLGEKIDSLSLSHNASTLFQQDFERRRENEKALPTDFHDRKPPLSQPVPNTTAYRAPSRLDSLAPRLADDAAFRAPSRMNNNTHDDSYRLTESDYRDRQLRSGITSVNTDLGAYTFTREDVQWPVPPRYNEAYRESTVLGSGFEGLSIGNGEGEYGRPRRGERGGWM